MCAIGFCKGSTGVTEFCKGCIGVYMTLGLWVFGAEVSEFRVWGWSLVLLYGVGFKESFRGLRDPTLTPEQEF